MNLLLDTHVWIWSLLDPDRLRAATRKRIVREDAELWLSPISAWEALLLAEHRRLGVIGDRVKWVETAWHAGPFREAALTFEVAMASRRVPVPVADPADRFLVATARVYGCAFVTADERLQHVPGLKVLTA